MSSPFVVGSQSFYLLQFLDEGVERSLENMIEKGGVNTLLLSTHIDFQSTKSWGPLTHAQADSFDCDGFNCEPHPEFYEATRIKPVKTTIKPLDERDVFETENEFLNQLDYNE